jgi:vancomycin resistance protein YoaR
VEIETPRVANRVPALEARYEANPDVPAGQFLQVDAAAEGADVNVTRTVKAPDGTIIRKDNIFTHYLPWGAIYQVNPGDSRLSQ